MAGRPITPERVRQSEPVARDFALLIREGHVATNADITQICNYRDFYPPLRGLPEWFRREPLARALRTYDMALGQKRVSGQAVYYNSRLPIDQTDLAKVEEKLKRDRAYRSIAGHEARRQRGSTQDH